MAFNRKFWKGKPDTTTPITAAELNRIEAGIDDAVDITELNSILDGERQEADGRYVPLWRAGEVVTAGTVRTANGVAVSRVADGTTRASYDSTEAALWTPLVATPAQLIPKLDKTEASNLYPLRSQVVTPAEFKKRRLSTTRTIRAWNLYAGGHGFTAGGSGNDTALTNMNDTADVIRGNQSAKLVTLTAGGKVNFSRNFTSVSLVGATAIRLYLKYDIAVAGQSLDLYIGKSDFSAYFNKDTIIAGGGAVEGSNFPWQAGRWEIIDIPLSDFGVNGTATPSWADISRIQLQLTGPAGTACTVRVASIEAIAPPSTVTPTIIFTMDDSSLSQKTICAPDLNSRGWPATLYPIVDLIGSDNAQFWDLAWAKQMRDTYSWEVGAHAWSGAAHGVGMPAMSGDRRIAEFESIASWLDANGFSAKTFAWPIGNHSRSAEDTAREYFTAALTATRVLNESACPPRRYAIQRLNAGYETLADIQTALTRVVADKGLLIFCIHDIVSGAASSGGNAMPPEKWASILAAVQTAVNAGAQVKTADSYISNLR